MITNTILSILGVVLLVVLWAMFKSPKTNRAIVAADPTGKLPAPAPGVDVEPWDARKGDVISITGAADDFSDIDFSVDRRSAYESGNHRWVDLSGEFRGQRVYLEIYKFPQPDLIGLFDKRKMELTDVPITEAQLTDLDTRQDATASVDFDKKRWFFESSREIGYFENETGQGEGLYRWVFREQDGPRLLCIEKWQGEPFDVRIARRLNARDITVYRAA